MEIGAVPHHICFALPPASPDHLARNLREQPPAAAPASSAPASGTCSKTTSSAATKRRRPLRASFWITLLLNNTFNANE
uniref:Uncharacterized protein n=1 Tax=Setaria italica TaxID=4555 RepID=K4AND6_SETIT